ncbi:MAG TPA: hypothetical protein PKL84_11890, partial [Candidatus Hydrogenedentes bacterium]|nr:hypothetical protein [Candidatus Hydrogenedentota bacterium]
RTPPIDLLFYIGRFVPHGPIAWLSAGVSYRQHKQRDAFDPVNNRIWKTPHGPFSFSARFGPSEHRRLPQGGKCPIDSVQELVPEAGAFPLIELGRRAQFRGCAGMVVED